MPPLLKVALQRRAPEFDVLRVGDQGAPLLGTLDPDVLRFLAESQRLFLTANRVSMPKHVAAHHAAGQQHSGVFRIRPGASLAELIEATLLLWEASEAEEWVDALEWLPFG